MENSETAPTIEKATISPAYRWRLGLIGFACLGIGVWSLYDGFVTYPRQKEIAETFLEFKERKTENWQEEWEAHAEAKGWPIDDPGKPKSDWDITVQFIFAGITFPIGLVYMIAFIRAGGRWIDADDGGLNTSWGQRVPFDTIVSVNKARWQAKGIAVVHYQEGSRARRVVLDDWKYMRKPTTELLKLVESHLNPDQIHGGPPESDSEELSAGEGVSESSDDPTPDSEEKPSQD